MIKAYCDKMLTNKEVLKTRAENYQRVKIFVRLFYFLGVNISAASPFKDSLKIISFLFVFLSGVSLCGHWNKIRSQLGNTTEATEGILTAFQLTIALVKLIYLIFTQRRFYELLERVLNHNVLQNIEIFVKDYSVNKTLKEEMSTIMNRVWTKARNQIVVYFIIVVSVLIMYSMPRILINHYHKVKGTPNYGYIPLLDTSYWDDRVMSFPHYYLHIFFDLCAIIVAGACSFCFDSLFITLCHHAIGLMKILCLLVLRSTTDLVPKEARVNYMRSCIRHYQRTILFIQDTQALFKHINLTHFLLAIIELALILFKMSVTMHTDKLTFIKMAIHFLTVTSMCVVYCYNGQQFSNTSEEISVAFANCHWYNESKEFKRLVQMMIMRTNGVMHFDISWFAHMNMATLLAMYKMSYSYFLLLLDVSD